LSLLSELQNSGGRTDISTHITASTISYYLEVTTKNSFNQRAIRTVSWHMDKSAQDIYATALTILQVGHPNIYNYLPTLSLKVSVQKKRIGYIKTSTIKSTALIYGGYPLLTEHYRVETLDQLWNQV
jgi:hypothetical protein